MDAPTTFSNATRVPSLAVTSEIGDGKKAGHRLSIARSFKSSGISIECACCPGTGFQRGDFFRSL